MSRKLLDWGVATLTLPGEPESGDRHVVKFFRNGALVAVVDGLGHGTEAAEAAELVVKTLEDHASESVIPLLRRCHGILPGTRGVVMSMAAFNAAEDTMTWLGVGNVEGVLLHADHDAGPDKEALLLRGGVVGGQLPGLRAAVFPVSPGDTLIFATDGILSDFTNGLNLDEPPQKVADRIMTLHRKGTDDALALVARYLGRGN